MTVRQSLDFKSRTLIFSCLAMELKRIQNPTPWKDAPNSAMVWVSTGCRPKNPIWCDSLRLSTKWGKWSLIHLVSQHRFLSKLLGFCNVGCKNLSLSSWTRLQGCTLPASSFSMPPSAPCGVNFGFLTRNPCHCSMRGLLKQSSVFTPTKTLQVHISECTQSSHFNTSLHCLAPWDFFAEFEEHLEDASVIQSHTSRTHCQAQTTKNTVQKTP